MSHAAGIPVKFPTVPGRRTRYYFGIVYVWPLLAERRDFRLPE